MLGFIIWKKYLNLINDMKRLLKSLYIFIIEQEIIILGLIF